jgi:hypothetical protein
MKADSFSASCFVAAQVMDLSADSAALPALTSRVVIVIPSATLNVHCNATGSFPDGEFILIRNELSAPRVAVEGETCSDWAQTPVHTTTRAAYFIN